MFKAADIPRIMPELMLLLVGLMVLLSDILERWDSSEKGAKERTGSAWQLALSGLGIVLAIALVQSGYLFRLGPAGPERQWYDALLDVVRNLQAAGPSSEPLLGMYATDHLTMVARLIFVIAAILTVLLTSAQPPAGNPGEFYALLLIATAGMCMMAGATDLTMAYLALELSSIALYVLAGYFHEERRSAEAGLKYFLFGALSSGILLYGMSLAYGFSASNGGATADLHTMLGQIGLVTRQVAETEGAINPLLTLALVFIIAGLGYKLAVVPFHSWAPDVYQGAPTPVTAFIATASKTAGFLMLYRLLATAFPAQAGTPAGLSGWSSLLAVLALATLVVGNLAALPQTNARRLLAYSSIGQAGFVLLALVLWGNPGLGANAFANTALLYYLVAYTLTTLGTFGVLTAIARAVGGDELKDLDGLARRNLPLAVLMSVLVLSLAGVPPLSGYWAKFFVFMAGYRSGAVWLVVVAVVMTVVSLYYYLRFLKAMWLNEPSSDTPIDAPRPLTLTLAGATLLVLLLGLFPNLIWDLLDRATLIAGTAP
ncbi:MAG TPA: NADH-quinone oxidoreductase subunit N [Roseiflexaceae bacterium]|nr:NADH-quinone oxidoreductase subunit N [Roseiflexaceae bacterium]